jgi:hypothetical protein
MMISVQLPLEKVVKILRSLRSLPELQYIWQRATCLALLHLKRKVRLLIVKRETMIVMRFHENL